MLGLARRLPSWEAPKTEWMQSDVAQDDLITHLRGADVLVHLPWLFQPTHDRLSSSEPGTVRVPSGPVWAALAMAWQLHLVTAPPELFDAVLRLPIMDVSRARRELGWPPRHSAVQAIQAFLDGLRAGEGKDTPPLTPDASGPLRLLEFLTGIGRRP